MLIEGTRTLAAPREAVWRALNDPAFLQRTLPDCRALSQTGSDAFTAMLETGIGPIRAAFDIAFRREAVETMRGYTLVGEGSAGVAGSASGSVTVSLADIPGGTLLTYAAQTAINGKLAQLGSRMIDGAARKFSERFFLNIQQALAHTGETAGSPCTSLPVAAQTVNAGAPVSVALPRARTWMMPVACGIGCFLGTLAAGWLH